MKPIHFFILISIILFTTSCNSDFVKITQKNPNYGFKETITIRKSDKKKHGIYKRYNESNKVVEIIHYKNDLEDGKRIFFYDNGDTSSVETYVNGIFEGPFREYYKKNILNIKYEYNNNKIQGKSHKYYKSGKLMEIVSFRDNYENGPFKEYYENGKIKAEGQYENGDFEQGELKLYGKDGKLEKIMNCEKGVCHTKWKADN